MDLVYYLYYILVGIYLIKICNIVFCKYYKIYKVVFLLFVWVNYSFINKVWVIYKNEKNSGKWK